MEDKSIDTGVAQNSTPTQADNGVTAQIKQPSTVDGIEKHIDPVDGKARVEAYLKRMCSRVGITVEEFWLLDEIQLAVDAVATRSEERNLKFYRKVDHHAWPFTAEVLASCVNQERQKTQKQPITESEIRSVMGKLFGSNKKSDFILIRNIEVRQAICKELDHDGNEIVVPRYSLKNSYSHKSFLEDLEKMEKGKWVYDDLLWEDFRELNGLFAPLDELRRSALKTDFVEDSEFSTMDANARIKAFWAGWLSAGDCVTSEEYLLLDDLLMCGDGPSEASELHRFASSADLAACVNAERAKNKPSMIWGTAGVMVTPLEISTLLERLFMLAGEDRCLVGDAEINRKLVQQVDTNGRTISVPHYCFEDMRNWDYFELEELEGELINRLIEMGVIVRTAERQWVNKHTEEVLFTCK